MSSRTVALLVTGMLITGSLNSLLTKYQDLICVGACDTARPHRYEQPVWQTLVMFVGEFLCLLVLYLSRLVRRLVPDNQKAAKYAALPTYDAEAAGDSGVVLSGSYAIEGAVAIKPGHNPPVGAHGPLPAPTAIVLDEIELAEVEDVLTWRQTCLFAIPTLCDLTGTTLMNLGLVLTPVSVFQMLRGALVLWVGLFSVLFLKRRLTGSQWASLFVVMLGVAVVGLSSTSGAPAAEGDEEGRDADRGLLGICLILFAQIFTATQFVLEEHLLGKRAINPLRAVGLEGFFGVITTCTVMLGLHAYVLRTPSAAHGILDVRDGLQQMHMPSIWLTSIAIACSIGLFNGFGLAVVKQLSAASRSTIDSCRTVSIWAISLALGWEELQPLKLVGFALLVYGTFVFNEVCGWPNFGCAGQRSGGRAAVTDTMRPSSATSSSRPSSRPATLSRRSAASLERGPVSPRSERTPLLGSQ